MVCMGGREFIRRNGANGNVKHVCPARWRGSVRLTGWLSCSSISGMSITIELPPELDQDVKQIPDVQERVIEFLRDQAEYEKWRKVRYSDEARQIVREGLVDAERDKAAGVSREESFRRFFEVYDRITAKLAEKQ